MRLLLTADTVGGVWTFACELAGELLWRGVDVLLVSFGRAPSESQRKDVAALNRRGSVQYEPTEVPLEWMPENREAYTAGAALLLELCEEFRPDALLLSQFCFGALPVPVPKIVVAHSDVLSWAEAVGKAPLAEDPWLAMYRRLVQTGLDGADLVVAPTAAMLGALRQNFRLQAPTTVIPNGRSLAEDPAVHRKLQAVTAGRMWDPAKNLRILNEADLPVRVFVAGEREGYVNGNQMLTLLNQLGGDALVALFRESAMYLCCSRYEPFGLAALEAALCGCAVVANDIPSLREVWGDGALYFQDAATLSSILRELVANASLLSTWQARAALRAQQYTAAAMAESYLKVIATLQASRIEAVRAA